MSKFGSDDEDMVCIYRSTTTNLDLQREFFKDIKSMIDRERRQILFGDFNIEATENLISREFKSCNFTQLENFPTHNLFGDFNIEATGNLISREFKSCNFTQLVNFPTHNLIKFSNAIENIFFS